MLETIYTENSEQFLWETDLKNCSLHMFVCSNEKKNYLFLCLCLFVDYQKKKGNKE